MSIDLTKPKIVPLPLSDSTLALYKELKGSQKTAISTKYQSFFKRNRDRFRQLVNQVTTPTADEREFLTSQIKREYDSLFDPNFEANISSSFPTVL